MTLLCYDEIWVREPRLMVPRKVPIGPVKLADRNGDSAGLITFCLRRQDLVNNTLATAVGGATYGSGPEGPCWVLDGGADSRVYWPALPNIVTGAQELTLEFLGSITATNSLGAIYGLYYGTDVVGSTSGANGRFRAQLSYTGTGLLDHYYWGAGNDYDSNVPIGATDTHIVWTKAAGTAACQITGYVNGVQIGQGNSNNGAAFADFTAYPVIGHRHSAATGTFTGRCYLFAAYNRVLDAAAVRRLYADPFARVIPT